MWCPQLQELRPVTSFVSSGSDRPGRSPSDRSVHADETVLELSSPVGSISTRIPLLTTAQKPSRGDHWRAQVAWMSQMQKRQTLPADWLQAGQEVVVDGPSRS